MCLIGLVACVCCAARPGAISRDGVRNADQFHLCAGDSKEKNNAFRLSALFQKPCIVDRTLVANLVPCEAR